MAYSNNSNNNNLFQTIEIHTCSICPYSHQDAKLIFDLGIELRLGLVSGLGLELVLLQLVSL